MKTPSPTKAILFPTQTDCRLCVTEKEKMCNNVNNTSKFITDNEREKITFIFGEEVKKQIDESDKICNRCTKLLDIFEEYIKFTKKVISQSRPGQGITHTNSFRDTPQPQLLMLLNQIFIKDRDRCTPSGLLTPVRSVYVDAESAEYNENSWSYFKHHNYANHYNSVHSDQTSDSEVQDIMEGQRPKKKKTEVKRRHRGHNWSRRKQRGRSRSRSHSAGRKVKSRGSRSSSKASMAHSVDNESSYSGYSVYSNLTIDELEHKPRTRANSRILEEVFPAVQNDEFNFKCDQPGCEMTFVDKEIDDVDDTVKVMYGIDELTTHLIKEHNKLALFWCRECKKRYTKQEHLNKHEENHYDLVTICPFCQSYFNSVREIQEHISDHLKYYVPCNYCDLQYLEATKLEEHIKNVHKEKKKIRVRPVKTKILFRLNKNSDENLDFRKKSPERRRKGKKRKHVAACTATIKSEPSEPTEMIRMEPTEKESNVTKKPEIKEKTFQTIEFTSKPSENMDGKELDILEQRKVEVNVQVKIF